VQELWTEQLRNDHTPLVSFLLARDVVVENEGTVSDCVADAVAQFLILFCWQVPIDDESFQGPGEGVSLLSLL
jgi:hypothetical protein